MTNWLKYALGIIVFLLVILLYVGWTPDIPHDELTTKYATGASDFIDLPSGTKAHYRVQGNDTGPTVLLLHGSNASLHTWDGWVTALEDDFFVVSVDLPGHGLTGPTPNSNYSYTAMAAFIKEFTEVLEINKFFLAGNSMGGAVSLQYALEYPAHILGLVLLDSAGIATPQAALKKVNRPLAFDLAGHWYGTWILQNITPRSMVIEGLEKSFNNSALITDEMIDRYWELVRHPGNREATNIRFAWYRDEQEELLIDKITLPTLIIWGEEDQLIPLEVGQAFHRRIKGSKLITFDGIGHIPMEESPVNTAKAAKAFMLQVASN